jgi:hypothetical protein
MFNPFRAEDPLLEEAIASAFADLKSHSADEEGYQKTVDQLTKLYAMKKESVALDPNKLLLIFGNVYVGLKVLNYEQTGVITSKLWSFMSKI